VITDRHCAVSAVRVFTVSLDVSNVALKRNDVSDLPVSYQVMDHKVAEQVPEKPAE
jgi:hypothetical protein